MGAESHHSYFTADAAPRFIDVLYARSAGEGIFPAWREARNNNREERGGHVQMPQEDEGHGCQAA
jgi:hypothetical protein